MKKICKALLSILTVLTVVFFTVTPVKEVQADNLDYSSVFNATYYAQHNPDLAAAGITSDQALLSHFVSSGMNEGRQGSEEFNVYAYMNRYPDLKATYGNNLKSYYLHYINNGKAEGRNGRADGATTTPTAPLAPVTPTYSNAGIKGTVSDKLQSSAQYPYAKGPSFIGMQPGKAQTVTETIPGGPVYDKWGNYMCMQQPVTKTKTVISGSGHTADEIAKANYNPSGLTSGYSALTGSAKIGDTRVMCYSLGATHPASQAPYYCLMECYAITSKGVPLFREVGSCANIYTSTGGFTSAGVAVSFVESVEPTWNVQQFAYMLANQRASQGDDCQAIATFRKGVAKEFLVEGYIFVRPNHRECYLYNPSDKLFYMNKTHSLSSIYSNGFTEYY